jgi:hypothetical protein
VFEGAPAKIPFAYREILEAEYRSRALTLQDFEGYGICVWSLTGPC